MVYLSSLPANFIDDFDAWCTEHQQGIIRNLENFTKQDSNLEFDGIERLDIKFRLLDNLSDQAHFPLPEALKRKRAVINVLHYADTETNRQRPSAYQTWLNEI